MVDTCGRLQLKATEKADSSHVSYCSLYIYSMDVNDNDPAFTNSNISDAFLVTFLENTPGKSYVDTVQASDADISPEFGNASLM